MSGLPGSTAPRGDAGSDGNAGAATTGGAATIGATTRTSSAERRGRRRRGREAAAARPTAAKRARPSVAPATIAAPASERRPSETVSADQLSLGRRLRQPRTIFSLVLPLVLLVLFARALPGFKLDAVPGLILQANPLLPARRLRSSSTPASRCAACAGRSSSAAPGFRLGLRDATEIIFISWLVNCLVPAKLGDLYRAYLLKINSTVSLSRTFGTVFIERILDLFAIVVLGLGVGLLVVPRSPAGRGPGRVRGRRRGRDRSSPSAS